MTTFVDVYSFRNDDRYAEIARGIFSLKYNDGTHLDPEDWRDLLRISVEGSLDGGIDSERSFKIQLSLDAKFSQNEQTKKRSLHVLTDAITLSAMRSGIIGPVLSADTAAQLNDLKSSRGIVLIPDTNSLYNGTLHWLLNVLRESTLWILPFVMSITQMQSREAALKAMLRTKKDGNIGQSLRSRAFVNAGLGLLERNNHRYQVLELDPSLLRYMKMPDKNGFDSDDSEVLEDRLLIEGIHAILRSTRTRAKQMVVTSDVTLSRILSAEGIANLCLPIPTLTGPVSNIRYDPWARTFVGTTIGGLLWDLAHTFGSVRLDDSDGERVRLSCYWPGKIAHGWQSEQLMVTWPDKPAPVEPSGESGDSGQPQIEIEVARSAEKSSEDEPNAAPSANGAAAALSEAAVPQASLPLVLRLAGAVYSLGGGGLEELVQSITTQQPAKGNATRGYEVLRRAKLVNFEENRIVSREELDELESHLRAGDLDSISKQFENYEAYNVVLKALQRDGQLSRTAVNDLLEEALKSPVAQEASVRLVRYHILLGQAWTDGKVWRDGSNRPYVDEYFAGFGESFDDVAHDNIAKVSDFLPSFCRRMRMSPWAATQAAQSYIKALSSAYSLQYAAGGKPTGTDKILSGSLLDVVESIVPLDRIEIGGRPVLTLGRVKK
ncbi:hypothetical protein GFB56_33810 [Ensifer sp. T173]|uniref:PIN domain-containing protein n=1 Tax=Ensifer canadensis TaxID=555315 RepID=A0AAW4FWL3_9HYPH|nr:hypothetical protein [Ensifer canadensis]MBM3095688.1 hypothetical protein [Ensifer canadensis]UBI79962.1 hypothetical protein J3R84_30560 [Ensifer canadensis]